MVIQSIRGSNIGVFQAQTLYDARYRVILKSCYLNYGVHVGLICVELSINAGVARNVDGVLNRVAAAI